MKRIIKQFIYLFFISIFVFTSCVNEIGNFENLDKSDSTSKQTYISIGSAVIADEINKSSRTIIANNTADLTDFVLNGTPSGGSERQLATAENITKLSAAKIPVTAGEWDFTLSAKFGEINFTGTTSAEITASNTTDNPKTLFFVLSSNVGYGGLNITMTFTGAADKVSVTLMDESNSSEIDRKDFTTFTAGSNNTHTFIYSRDVSDENKRLADGTYFLIFDFYKIKDSEEFKLNTSRNLIRIANGINTTASLSVSLNDAYEITYKYYVGDSELTDTTGISIAANSSSQVLPYSFSRKSEILLPTLTYSDPSYQFAGWYESSDFSGTPVTKIEKGSSGNKTLYARFVSSTLYVSQSGNNENDGMTASTALASVNKAVEKIISYGNIAAAYTIKISGTIIGGVNIASTLTTEMASSLTLEGVTGKTGDTWVDVLDGGFTAGNTGTTLTLSTIVPVIIKNLKITGGYARDAGGIELYAKSFLTMDSGEISGNTGLDHAGGVYLHHGNGTWNGSSYTNIIPGAVFTMNDGTICNNTGEGITLYDGIAPGEFNMNGGTITGNSGYGVNIVNSASGSFGKFTMKGDAVVAANNKVFLGYPGSTKIYIAGELTESAPVATVSLNGYNDNTEIVALAEGVTDTSLLSAACAKIEVAPNNGTPWYLTSDGKITATNPNGSNGGNNFFVNTTGDDEASGLDAEHPLKTIMAAIGKMNNSNVDYVINVMGDLFQANFSEEYKLELTEDINGKAKSITFKGNADSGTYDIDGQSGGDPTTVMKVTTSVPIIIEGITVTGGCADSSHLGGAIYIGEESTVILGQDTIVNGGGSHGCGSAIYVAASENGGVTKAGTLIMKDNAVVNADDFGEVYLCTGATIKVASALTGQSSVWDSNSGEYIPSSIVAKITPQVYAENTPVIALTDDAPDTLNISDIYEKFAVFGTEAVSCSITNEGKLSISSVTLKTGTAINTIFQKLGGVENPVITDDGTATSDTTITAFAKSTTAPSSAEFYLDENSIIPVWLDGTTIKYYKPEGCTLYLNSDSSYMFCQLKNITSIDTTDLNTSNVTNMYCLFNSCEKLSTVDLSSFDTSKVTNMAGMFGNCTALSSVDLSSFNTQNVTTMCNMFVSCKGLTVLDLSSFDTRSLENTAGLVGHMTNLTKIYVDPDNWNMTKVTESTSMFWECQNLVGGQGTTCSNSASGVEYARIDGGSGAPGYLTDIADKPAATNDFTTFTGGEISAEGIYGNGEGQDVGGKYTISNIAVCNHLVTQSEYETYMTYFGAENSGDYPGNTISDITSAYYVSWVDAIVYCNLRSLAEGLTPVYTMNGSYDMRTDSNPWTQNYHIAKNASGKYFYDYYEEDTNWDLDQLNLETNFSANGYRLPTSWEYAYIVQSNPNFIDTEGLFEWAHNFFYDYSRVFFDPSSKKVDNSGKNINSREENLGFRVVRNAVSNSGSNP